jgi:molecular chaperone DnaJ
MPPSRTAAARAGPAASISTSAGFADIFDEMFGEFMGGRGGGAARGADLRYNMEVALEDAFNGKTAQIRVPTSVTCGECQGSGAEKGSQPTTCTTCQGHGRVRAQQGFFTIERGCPTCNGAGRVIEKPCKSCAGAGRVRKEKTLQVNIPAGVEDGTRIRLAGEGEAGMRAAAAGDLYIFLSVAPHRLFTRDGADIYCRAPIPMTTAALGGDIEVPTIDGSRATVTLPEGTQANRQFRLRGKGMRVLHSKARGDMYVQVQVETPVNLTKRQEELLREFDSESKGRETHPESEGFFAKVREFWDDLTE